MILQGDALSVLRSMESDSVDCIVTSPPYWGLRDYGCDGQIGLEPTVQEFISGLVDVFAECYRLLKPTGTLWVNMGDCYSRSGGKSSATTNKGYQHSNAYRSVAGMGEKNLIGQPWRLALALQDFGWILRRDIIWEKPAPMPESCKDRCTTAHEYIFHFSKLPDYWYDQEAIAEICARKDCPPIAGWDTGPGSHCVIAHNSEPELPDNYKGSVPGRKGGPGQERRSSKPRKTRQEKTNERYRLSASARMGRAPGWREEEQPQTKNARSIWRISPAPSSMPHYAAFPPELPTRCILAGCPEGGLVLDPFVGTGTTVLAALQSGRRGIGIELNPRYVELANQRISAVTPNMFLEAAS